MNPCIIQKTHNLLIITFAHIVHKVSIKIYAVQQNQEFKVLKEIENSAFEVFEIPSGVGDLKVEVLLPERTFTRTISA